MNERDARSLKIAIVVSVFIVVLLIYLPSPAFSQQGIADANIQDLIVNGGFEGGFQDEFGIGYGWGAFSNGNAVVGWNFDDWDAVVVDGAYSQRIEIRDALDHDRYAGVYQTVSVVPGQQYKLIIKGMIRSEEGDIDLSDYGYRLQYAVDFSGDTAWELVNQNGWQELPWDEQTLSDPDPSGFRHDTFETTITATGDQLTLFVRGWKKWINNGSGIFNLDEISFVGPAPDGFQAPIAQAAAAGNLEAQAAEGLAPGEDVAAVAENPTQAGEDQPEVQTDAAAPSNPIADNDSANQTTISLQSQSSVQNNRAPAAKPSPLPVSGLGSNDSQFYVITIGLIVLSTLVAGAVLSMFRQRNLVE